MKGVALAMLAMLAVAQVMVHPSEAISCGQLTSMLSPCLNYLRYSGNVTPQCCNGVRSVAGATRSQADRRTACYCAKSAAGQMKIRHDTASSLPGKCGVGSPIPINPSVDCSTIS